MFSPRLRFDAAGHIHGVGSNGKDRFGNVLRRQTACEKNTMRFRRGVRQAPVGGVARAAKLAGVRRVEQERGSCAIFGEWRQRASFLQMQGLDHGNLLRDLSDELW